MNEETIQSGSKSRFSWSKIPVLARALVVGLFVNTLAVGLWPSLALQFSIPVAFVLMAIFLWLYCKYLSGSWKPRSTVKIRRENFRDIHLSKKIWLWGGFGALLLWVNKTAFGEFIFRLFPFPNGAYSTSINYFNSLSTTHALLAIVMTSVVAGIAEETGLRGYVQKPLERKYGPWVAIGITSLAFMAIHIPQVSSFPYLFALFTFSVFFGFLAFASNSLLPGIIIHAIIDIHAFLYLTGFFGDPSEYKPTIFEIGVDSHFILSSAIVLVTGVLFALVIRKLIHIKKTDG